MSDDDVKDKPKSAKDWPRSEDGRRVISIVIPKACKRDGSLKPWHARMANRIFFQLAMEHTTQQATLTREQLAELVDAFKEEPLPESLRLALIDELMERRGRKQGRKEIQHTALEQVELAMLPGVYDEAMQDAKNERACLKSDAQNQPRRSPETEIPTQREIALQLVRERLPSLSHFTDQRLRNLISTQRGLLKVESRPKS